MFIFQKAGVRRTRRTCTVKLVDYVLYTVVCTVFGFSWLHSPIFSQLKKCYTYPLLNLPPGHFHTVNAVREETRDARHGRFA